MVRSLPPLAIVAGLALLAPRNMAANDAVPLVPRSVFFGNPDRAGTQISPDGKHLSWLAADNGVMNVWVAPRHHPDQAKVVTKDTKRGIRTYFWAHTNRHLIYLQDDAGDENFHAHSVDIETGADRDLTPIKGVRAEVEVVTDKFPDEILVAINDRFPGMFHDLYRINIVTGEKKLVYKNLQYAGVIADRDFRPRFAAKFGASGGMDMVKLVGEKAEPFDSTPFEDSLTTQPVGFDKSQEKMLIIDSRGRDTGALYEVDLATKERKLIAEDSRADLGPALVHPTEYTIQAVSFNYDRNRWKFLDPKVEEDFAVLAKVCDGEIMVQSRTHDDRVWVVGFMLDNGPGRAYVYDRDTKKATFLFTNRKSLEGLTLAKMQPVVIKSRDGLNLVSYLTIPPDPSNPAATRPAKPLPMVLLVHGGPWARDNWGYNAMHQWLANRGYAVLSVNFRGSTGFGKKFVNAGNLEWAAKMHDDLIDAVDWAIAEKVADPAKVGIMGGSYGGYATLVGLTYTPDKFACGVDIVGPSNIVTLLKSIPSYWAPAAKQFHTRVGDPNTAEGKKLLEERSPLNRVDAIRRPLLIGQGANDPRVKQAESDQIVKAMQTKKIPVTYALFPDEGHGFARPENSQAFFAVTDLFLSKHLGGRAEPVSESTLKTSTIQIKAGAELIDGLPKGN
jgi:dipeptidyl aminopeptidase/acylaminoacyl peptidase